jgi:hypothetical protein
MTCFIENINLKINNTQNVLFIDLSYYIFYRYHAYINWYQLAKEIKLTDENIQIEFSKQENIEHFKKLCISKLNELKKKYKIKDNNNIYLLKDCARTEIWRNDLIDDYKERRKQNLFIKSFYGYGIKEVIDNSGFQVISHATLEADDVAYISLKNLKKDKDLNFDKKITIITDDSDYIQLLKYNNVQIINLKNKDISSRLKNQTVDEFLKLKIINGDISDNINSIFKHLSLQKIYDSNLKKDIKITKKLIEEIAKDQQLFVRLIKNNKEKSIYENYIQNKKLIDFTEIPEKFHNIVKYSKID